MGWLNNRRRTKLEGLYAERDFLQMLMTKQHSSYDRDRLRETLIEIAELEYLVGKNLKN